MSQKSDDFKAFMEKSGIMPLKAKKRAETNRTLLLQEKKRLLKKNKAALPPEWLDEKKEQLSQTAETQMSYFSKEVSVAKRKAMQKGDFLFTARLDLHGMNAKTAEKTVVDFLQWAKQKNQTHLLMIHGKGDKKGNAPVLKNLLHNLLHACPDVSAFCSASERHGGLGAVYVLLAVDDSHEIMKTKNSNNLSPSPNGRGRRI